MGNERKKVGFLTAIDESKWEAAGWHGVIFGHDPSGNYPPMVGLLFRNIEAGKSIFAGWRESLADNDKFDELRLAFIEGEIPNKESGYSVSIGLDIENVRNKIESQGGEWKPDYILTTSRFHRMNPNPGSNNLEIFKQNFQRHGTYFLVPASGDYTQPSSIVPLMDLKIQKRKVYLRNITEITEEDIDHAGIKML